MSSNNRLSFTIYIPVTKEFLLLGTMISPCYNSCSANTEYIWNNAWLQRLFYNGKKPLIEWNPLNQRVLKKWWLQVLASKKHRKHENTRSLQIVSWNNDGTSSLLVSCCFDKIFVHLQVMQQWYLAFINW